MVRRLKRWPANQTRSGRHLARDSMNRGDVNGQLLTKIRKNCGDALGQQSLAHPRRTKQGKVVSASSRDFNGKSAILMTTHIRHINGR